MVSLFLSTSLRTNDAHACTLSVCLLLLHPSAEICVSPGNSSNFCRVEKPREELSCFCVCFLSHKVRFVVAALPRLKPRMFLSCVSVRLPLSQRRYKGMQETAVTRELKAAEDALHGEDGSASLPTAAAAAAAAAKVSSLLDRGMLRLLKRNYDGSREVCVYGVVRCGKQFGMYDIKILVKSKKCTSR